MNDLGDDFYRLVAEVWTEAKVPAPGQAVAQTWQVPSTTAHRWVKEARRRGLLKARMGDAFCRVVHCPDCGGKMRHTGSADA